MEKTISLNLTFDEYFTLQSCVRISLSSSINDLSMFEEYEKESQYEYPATKLGIREKISNLENIQKKLKEMFKDESNHQRHIIRKIYQRR